MTPTSTASKITPSTGETEISQIVSELHQHFRTGFTRDIAWRKRQLGRIKALVEEHEQALAKALSADLGKSNFEAWAAELNYVAADVDFTIKNLNTWLKPEKVKTPLTFQPSKSWIIREPLGVALIIGPWNYPVQLVLAPLVGAIAAGNCAIIKPSEISSQTAKTLAELIPRYLDDRAVRVITGGVEETTELLQNKFDHIFFTGSTSVGRIIMCAAAEHLTPVTLELGGKSPCIVDQDVDVNVAARRIIWGKTFNAGQTCVAPDYILVQKSVHDKLLNAFATCLSDFFGDDPSKSEDLGRIVNDRHFARLKPLLSQGTVKIGGSYDESTRYMEPTIMTDVPLDSDLMTDEIFGPILPVIPYDDLEEAINFINDRPKPLALYVFSNQRDVNEQVLAQTSSGGACVNQTLLHLAVRDLPFGGVGASGMGAYHGKWSIETFSHRKSVMKRSTMVDADLMYPPFTDSKKKWMKRLL